eukprot:COSAG02_NODE_26205_length_638_cov_1.139147_1_plen_46_part_01
MNHAGESRLHAGWRMQAVQAGGRTGARGAPATAPGLLRPALQGPCR